MSSVTGSAIETSRLRRNSPAACARAEGIRTNIASTARAVLALRGFSRTYARTFDSIGITTPDQAALSKRERPEIRELERAKEVQDLLLLGWTQSIELTYDTVGL